MSKFGCVCIGVGPGRYMTTSGESSGWLRCSPILVHTLHADSAGTTSVQQSGRFRYIKKSECWLWTHNDWSSNGSQQTSEAYPRWLSNQRQLTSIIVHGWPLAPCHSRCLHAACLHRSIDWCLQSDPRDCTVCAISGWLLISMPTVICHRSATF